MGLLDKILKDDAAASCDLDGFGEEIVYTPRGGSPATYKAIVFRDLPEPTPDSSRGNHPDIEIELPDDGTRGPSAIDTGGDAVTVAKRFGETPISMKVTKVILQGTGFWRLQLR